MKINFKDFLVTLCLGYTIGSVLYTTAHVLGASTSLWIVVGSTAMGGVINILDQLDLLY